MKIYTPQAILDQVPTKSLQGPAVILAGPQANLPLLVLAGIELTADFPQAEKQSTHYEIRDGYDFLSLSLPDLGMTGQALARMDAYLKADRLLVTGSQHLLDKLDRQLALARPPDRLPLQALILFFNSLLDEEAGLLDDIDDQIESLESMDEADPRERLASIVPIRKKLQGLKRYYQGLLEVFEEMGSDGNQHFSSDQIKVLRAQKKKADRILRTIVDLRDQLNQAREALQNQLDISLNETMRFFTVITAVFLPPTLLVGWYGMNLRMPELDYALTYPLVALASFAFIVLSLLFSKKKGWF
ncbi:MAG: hypothetical protein GX838_06745 [Clostridiaceae bacterium]|nr:hypothetical protein [Clostridiaceae bacterium]